jgi:hypothetical protein
MHRIRLVATLAVFASGCGASTGLQSATPTDLRVNNPFSNAYNAVPLDDGQIKVIASDFAGVSLGQCTSDIGAVLPRSCAKDPKTIRIFVRESEDPLSRNGKFDGGKLSGMNLHNELFGQYTHLKSVEASASSGIAMVGAQASGST